MSRINAKLGALGLSSVVALGFGGVSRGADEAAAVPEVVRQLNEAFVQVAERVSPAVVVIRVAHTPNYTDLQEEGSPLWRMLPREFREHMEEQRRKQRQRSGSEEPIFDGQGSGVVIRKEGYILTNRHVVEGAERIRVGFADGREYEAKVRGVDVQSDLAVIKIEPKEELRAAKLGDSAKTRVGEFAVAIGAPFELDYSVTFGHVSAKGRSHIVPDQAMDQDFIQTDADINPGNSGGPLANIEGEVIGINTMIRGLRTGIGFAIPINLAKEVAEQLIVEGKFVRSWLGIGIRALRDDKEFRKMLPGLEEGVIVSEIRPDGPASKSDLRPSDVIVTVDGQAVKTAQELKNEIRSKKIGKEVVLEVHRKDKLLKVTVKPEAWPEQGPPVAEATEPEPKPAERTLGLTVERLTPELAEQQGVDKLAGVVVTEVEQHSPADEKGLRPGDIITEVNQKLVNSPKDFQDALRKSDLKKGVIITFTSRGVSKFEILKQGD